VILRATVDVATSADDVFDAAVDWVSQARWMPLTRVEVVGGDGRSVGTRVVARTGVGRLAADDPMVIEVWEPPHRCEVRHEGRVVRGRGVFLVHEITPQRCRFTWEEQLPSGAAYGLIARSTAPLNRLFFGLALRRFARWVEAGRP
jgi:hypothetical protein